jgi:glyoxylase-like metal-dependent hydrolase (beta-lactamase superfamily II)
MQQIGKGIYFEDSYLGVTIGGLVFSHGTVYIDAPLRMEDMRSWRSALMTQRSGNHRLLINLDAHPDRTLGSRVLDCTILAQQKTAQVFRNRPSIFKGQAVETGAAWEEYSEAIGLRWAPPDITFTQFMSLFWGGPEILLENHPGATAGAIWVIVPSERLAFVGDTLVINQPPFLASADLPAWIESLEQLKKSYAGYTLVGGRGGQAVDESLDRMLEGIQNALDGMEKLSKRHAPPEATENLIPGLMEDFAVAAGRRERYLLRLRHGLFQYYSRHYRPSSSIDPIRNDDND